MEILTNLGLIALGLLGLFFGGNWLVEGASRIARVLGVPPLIVGLTIVAFGTSAPELVVSVRAALTGSSGIALGNVIGSNIANVGLILGVAGLIAPISVHVGLVRREIPLMIGVSLLTWFLAFDAVMSRPDGIILLVGFALFNALMIYLTLNRSKEEKEDANKLKENDAPVNMALEWVKLLGGIAVLVLGAELTVRGSVGIATLLGVPDVIIGLTLVAVGTSLPELAASVIAAMRGQSDLAVGNVVGSNIFNILLILGVTTAISPFAVPTPGTWEPYSLGVVTFDLFAMFFYALLMLPFALDRVLTRVESSFYLMSYVGFIVVAFVLK